MPKEPGTQIVLTPHPVTLDGQRFLAAEFGPGETLGTYLQRVVPDWERDAWEIRVQGDLVPAELLYRVRPKHGTVVEVRGIVRKQVLAIVAIAALAYFTFGIGAYGGALLESATAAFGTFWGSVATFSAFAAGSILINKVLGPKMPKADAQQHDPVYSITSARNEIRPYDPLPILFGSVRIAPDILSLPFTWYYGDDQYLGIVLTPGVNVHSIDALYNGDTLLSTYEGVVVYKSGFPGHTEQEIPLYSNVDTIAGGALTTAGAYVTRTSSADTIRLQVDIEGLIYDVDTKGRFKYNAVTIEIQYAPTGTGTWTTAPSLFVENNNSNTVRRTASIDVASGQYDVRVRVLTPTYNEGTPKDECSFTWVALKSIQADPATYSGIPRIGLEIKATGQLNGALDEVRGVAHSKPSPLWNGSSWSTVQNSNPGAHLLAYARGFLDGDGNLIAGIGLADSQIDIPALQAFMVHCTTNGYTYDAYIKDARNHQAMVDAIALAGMGQHTWAGGKFSVVWAADGQPITAVANMANIKRASFQVDYTLANAADGVEYTYASSADWKTKTIRVPAPGVTTMLNPARLTGEGITTEAHAAKLARWHLAQSLYQYKDISFSQDLEYLSYRRLSVLSLSHDLTQWGYSGRLRAAVNVSGTITITLDEPVPAPVSGTAYVGLRIPGEGAYRVFAVATFVGTTTSLTLVGAWPGGVAFPGDAASNPAHDTIWCYDFKSTPGARVRVVQLRPESGLQGAAVAVVPETQEFWDYVNTGSYVAPPVISTLPVIPTASNLRITDMQMRDGGGITPEMQVAFDVAGPMSYAQIHLWRDDGTDMVYQGIVAETRTNVAHIRTFGTGVYQVEVRPFNLHGQVGTAVTGTHTVEPGVGILDFPFAITGNVVPRDSGAVKRGGAYAWDSSIYSLSSFTGGAFVSFQPTSTDVQVMVGLNTDPTTDSDYTSIDYALYCYGVGNLGAYESGVNAGFLGTFAVGDDLSVTYDGAIVRYLKNGVVLREVMAGPGKRFYLDSSFCYPGAAIQALRFGPFGTTQPVMFNARGNCVVSDTHIGKVGGVTGWDSDVYSLMGYQVCHVTFKANQANLYLMVGLSVSPVSNLDYTGISYALYPKNDGTVDIYESGTPIGTFGSYTTKTLFAITYDGATVTYWKDGVSIRTVSVAGLLLYMDSSFYNVGAGINSLRWGPTTSLDVIDTYQISPGAVTEAFVSTDAGPLDVVVTAPAIFSGAIQLKYITVPFFDAGEEIRIECSFRVGAIGPPGVFTVVVYAFRANGVGSTTQVAGQKITLTQNEYYPCTVIGRYVDPSFSNSGRIFGLAVEVTGDGINNFTAQIRDLTLRVLRVKR